MKLQRNTSHTPHLRAEGETAGSHFEFYKAGTLPLSSKPHTQINTTPSNTRVRSARLSKPNLPSTRQILGPIGFFLRLNRSVETSCTYIQYQEEKKSPRNYLCACLNRLNRQRNERDERDLNKLTLSRPSSP